MDTTILTPRRGQNARRNETNGAANNRSSLEPAESSGSDEHGNDNAAGAPGSGDNSSDNDERSDAETEASSSEADEDSTDSEELPAMVNKLAENEIPATSIRVLFNKRLRGLKRKLEHLLLEFSQDREKSGWPESLPCVDPNARETSVDVNWANRFLSFAQECGWIIRAGHAPQPNRQALPGQAFRLRGTEPTPHEAAPAPAAAGISALLALQLGRPMPTEATADADNASDREALGRADPGDADVSGVRRHGQRRPPEAIPAGSPPPRRSGRDRIPSRRIADDVGDTSLMQPGARPFQAELRLTFGDDEEGQNVQQTVWSAWRGEASNRRQPLIDESNFEFATIGTLDLPEHAAYWQQLCNHQQLFTADALNVVKSSLERCSLQGDAQEETGQASQGAAPAPSPLASDTQFPLKQPFGDLDLQFSGERTHRESPEREASSAS
ncbi:g10192 [Coccomyxa viridis]|uniref:G10192 protein n=1 Tax=Coccomyxa viridis TaxID=1274662 RepID=A0ABP1FI81_9CHLO